MKFSDVLSIAGTQPFFDTGLLLAGEVNPTDVRRQLSRWVSAGKLRQLRRGLYMFEPPYQIAAPHPFLIANALMPGSYVSGQSALAYYGLIPEYTPRTISITLARPSAWDGGYIHHHLAPHLFFGYQSIEVTPEQYAFIAFPEKALLDLAHLTPGSDSPNYLSQLRLQNLEKMDVERMMGFVERAGKPKWKRVANRVLALAAQEKNEYEELV
jgi:predicted transcriptional regulator of viral defense system